MKTWILAGIAAAMLFVLAAGNTAKASDADSVESTLALILKNQEKMFDQLAEIKKELQIVKVRATQK